MRISRAKNKAYPGDICAGIGIFLAIEMVLTGGGRY